MSAILQYTPGSQVSVVLQILNETTGVREDGYSLPVISQLVLPDLSVSVLYPLDMTRLDTGLYYHRFLLPTGSAALGTYIVDISYTNAAGDPKNDYVQIVCSATAGQFSVSPG